MTNFERWQIYCADLSSPQNFIDWGFYYMIGAALQRRVWIGPIERGLFANKIVILCGPPGVGKGIVINPVSDILRKWKLTDRVTLDGVDPKDQDTLQVIRDKDAKKALDDDSFKQGKIEPLLIPIGADTTTFEAVTRDMANATRHVEYIKIDVETGRRGIGVYGHASICFNLTELESLFSKKTEKLISLLMDTYDCKELHVYKTKNCGDDFIRRGCINIIAGTTPHFLESIFDDGLVTEGFSSRIFPIYSAKPRFHHGFLPDFTPEQVKMKEEITLHIRKLTALYGQVKISKDTENWFNKWYSEYMGDRKNRINKATVLDSWYPRKNIHIPKLALAIHFSNSTEMEIGQECFEQAMSVIEREEPNMDKALAFTAKNPISNIARKILNYLDGEWRDVDEVVIDWHKEGPVAQIQEALSFLLETGQVIQDTVPDKHIPDKKIIRYRKK